MLDESNVQDRYFFSIFSFGERKRGVESINRREKTKRKERTKENNESNEKNHQQK